MAGVAEEPFELPAGDPLLAVVAAGVLHRVGVDQREAALLQVHECAAVGGLARVADAVKEGAVGVGTGATVGKLFGMGQAMKSGIGCAAAEAGSDNAQLEPVA